MNRGGTGSRSHRTQQHHLPLTPSIQNEVLRALRYVFDCWNMHIYITCIFLIVYTVLRSLRCIHVYEYLCLHYVHTIIVYAFLRVSRYVYLFEYVYLYYMYIDITCAFTSLCVRTYASCICMYTCTYAYSNKCMHFEARKLCICIRVTFLLHLLFKTQF